MDVLDALILISLIIAAIWITNHNRKDIENIDDINETSGDIKNDISEMKSLVCTTDKNVRQLRDELLVRRNQIDSSMECIESMVKKQQLNELIRQRVSGAIVSPEYIVNAVKSVYDRNAELERDNANLINENKLLQSQNNDLQRKNDKLTADNNQLKKRLHEKSRD